MTWLKQTDKTGDRKRNNNDTLLLRSRRVIQVEFNVFELLAHSIIKIVVDETNKFEERTVNAMPYI